MGRYFFRLLSAKLDFKYIREMAHVTIQELLWTSDVPLSPVHCSSTNIFLSETPFPMFPHEFSVIIDHVHQEFADII